MCLSGAPGNETTTAIKLAHDPIQPAQWRPLKLQCDLDPSYLDTVRNLSRNSLVHRLYASAVDRWLPGVWFWEGARNLPQMRFT